MGRLGSQMIHKGKVRKMARQWKQIRVLGGNGKREEQARGREREREKEKERERATRATRVTRERARDESGRAGGGERERESDRERASELATYEPDIDRAIDLTHIECGS